MASNTANRTDNNHARHHTATTETKPAFKTTELIAYVVVALGVLIASAVVDQNEQRPLPLQGSGE